MPRPYGLRQIGHALAAGASTFLTLPAPSLALAAIAAVVGGALLAALGALGLAPMALPVAGGFLLLAPALLDGFFHLAELPERAERPRLRRALSAIVRAPGGIWLLRLLCAFLFLIWITDAAILYSMMIGGEALGYGAPWLIRLQPAVIGFELWAALMGAVLAGIVFTVTAFSIPLLYEGRAGLVQAVSASVRAVLGNPAASLVWGLLLGATTLVSILLLPLLCVTLPVLAYASLALYREVFPPAPDG
ncbi:DUF2189 domain-containing protein [Thiohalobacter sp. IOR34]|uniref:DUF2189 domain-containing protein n=1 Tax=Thiohalobacter sp. IOR34 TaxID=3057176 RepID=UPI0025B11FD8|nr:DUF2189 domain-containing protein [Thiohalobacter sp. IOR34]WJW76534.1 DUF2189 domain-containing protein [Thiohalobacter sp. IOR34]